jgi:hypothetical protein
MACLTDNQFQDLPEEEWSSYYRRIWDSFEGLVDELMRGEPGVPSAVSLGLYKNQPAILASSWLDGSSYEELYIYPVEESEHPAYVDVRDC